MPLQIVHAQLSDIAEIARLNRVAQDLHVRIYPDVFRADWNPIEIEAVWKERLNAETSTVALAMLDGEAVGCIWFEAQELPANELVRVRRRLYVHHLVVDEKTRGHGVGAKLMEHAEGEARRLGMSIVMLDTWAGNSVARSFFAARGYDPFRLNLAKAV